MNNDPPDEESIPVAAHTQVFTVPGSTTAEDLHHTFERMNEGFSWDADPAVVLLFAPDSGEGEVFAVLAVVEIRQDEVKPHRILPDLVDRLVEATKAFISQPYHLVAFSFFAEGWGYDLQPEDYEVVSATEESWIEFTKTAVRFEGKLITTIDVETGNLIDSKLIRDKDEHFVESTVAYEGEIPEVLREIAAKYRGRSV